MESIHAFSVYSLSCSVAAHGADLLVDVAAAVDAVLLYAAGRYPAEDRIVDLSGVAVIGALGGRPCPGASCRIVLFRHRRLRLGGRVIFRHLVGIGDVIRGLRRGGRFFLTALLFCAAVGEARGGAGLILREDCLGVVGGCACYLGALRGGGRKGRIRIGIFLPCICHAGPLCGRRGEVCLRLPCQEPGACEDGHAQCG